MVGSNGRGKGNGSVNGCGECSSIGDHAVRAMVMVRETAEARVIAAAIAAVRAMTITRTAAVAAATANVVTLVAAAWMVTVEARARATGMIQKIHVTEINEGRSKIDDDPIVLQ